MKASIMLEDGPDGTMQAHFEYDGGFTPTSHAHQHILLLTKYLGAIAEQREPMTVEGGGQDELCAAMADPTVPGVPLPSGSDGDAVVAALTRMREGADAQQAGAPQFPVKPMVLAING